MKRITSESEIEEVMKDIGVGDGEELKESEKRRRNLEKFAQLRSRNPQTTVTLDRTHTAFVEANESEEGEFLDITITTRDFPQQTYTLPGDYHDYLIQKGMVIHEAAHVMYSDYKSFKNYYEKVEDEDDETHAQMFKNVFNALEDGAIEKFSQEDYRVREELFHMRSTLHESNYMGLKVVIGNDEQYHYPFYFAVMTALMNIGVYDNGELRKLLDEDNDTHQIAFRGGEQDRKMLVKLLPDLRNAIENIQSERDAKNRADLIYQIWKKIKKKIDRSTTPGKKEMERQQAGRDADNYSDGVPENFGEQHGEQQKSSTGGGDSEDNAEEKQTLGDERDDIKEEIEQEVEKIEEKGKEGIIEETKQEGNDWSDEVEEVIDSLGAGDGVDEVFIPDDKDVDIGRKREAERNGQRCAKIFRTRLQRARKDKDVSGKRRGRFDTRRLTQADRGSAKVFKKTQEGDEKDYSCMIVCDRSGSMSSRLEDVELAAGSVAYGLEAVGVDTCVLDTYESKTSIAKPFQTEVENFTEKLFAGRIGGGTPLRHTVDFAKERMERGGGLMPFMIVITDGKPYDEDQFKQEIKEANFPVIGLYLTEKEDEKQLKLYDRAVTVSRDEDVSQKLINLINSIMF